MIRTIPALLALSFVGTLGAQIQPAARCPGAACPAAAKTSPAAPKPGLQQAAKQNGAVRPMPKRLTTEQMGPALRRAGLSGVPENGDVKAFLEAYRQRYADPEFQLSFQEMESETGLAPPTPEEMEQMFTGKTPDPLLESQTADNEAVQSELSKTMKAMDSSSLSSERSLEKIARPAPKDSLRLPDIGEIVAPPSNCAATATKDEPKGGDKSLSGTEAKPCPAAPARR